MILTKHKHLISVDRFSIQEALTNNIRLKDIAKLLRKDPTNISKEIKRNRVEVLPSSFNQDMGKTYYASALGMKACLEY